MSDFAVQFLGEAKNIPESLDADAVENMAAVLRAVRDEGGRLFLGVGGSAEEGAV